MRHAQGWRDLQSAPRKLIPAIPLHRGREYHNAATHGDVLSFRQRQIARGLRPKEAA